MKPNDRILRLIERYQELAASPKNKARRERWGNIQHVSRDVWRGTARLDRSCQKGQVPVIAGMSNLFWHKKFGFSMQEYLLDPDTFLENFLKICIERFEKIDDDYVLDYQIQLRMASVFEAAMFGARPIYGDDIEPFLGKEPVITCQEDLDALPAFNFRETGLMPKGLRLYDTLQEYCGDIFEVHFPEWIRAPWGVALYICGFTDLLMDIYDEPEFVENVMDTITRTEMAYFQQRAAYTGKPLGKINLYNDDVSFPIVSPKLYRELILPREQQLSELSGGIYYWHSCGCLDPLYREIRKVPGLEMIHCSAWSDPKACVETFHDTAIEVCTNTQKDVIDAAPQEMYEHFKKICSTLNQGDALGYCFHMEGLEWEKSEERSFKLANEFACQVRAAARDAAEEK